MKTKGSGEVGGIFEQKYSEVRNPACRRKRIYYILHTESFRFIQKLTTSFQVKADQDLGKFSGMEPVPSNELTFDQWKIDVCSYQTNVPKHILLPAIRKSIIGKAQLVIRNLGPNYSVEDVVTCLAQEYGGVASSDIVFKEFYQLKQERNEKVHVFSIRLRDALANLSSQFPERAPQEDHEIMLRD